MVQNTLMFHHRQAHGSNVRVNDAMNAYLRLRSADRSVTTTQMVPGAAQDCPDALDRSAAWPPMCMIDLFNNFIVAMMV
jgi:hypothetical protein